MDRMKVFFLVITLLFAALLYKYNDCFMKYTNYNYVIENNILRNNEKSFLNVGLWDEDNNTMEKAQTNMFKKFFELGELEKEQTVLETGCGSGEHYLYWNSLNNKSKIVSLEKFTKPHPDVEKLDNVTFIQTDANNLNDENYYDKILIIESSFHYEKRNEFFKKCYSALKKDGKMIIADIIINDINSNILDYLLLLYYKRRVLNIPEENCIDQTTYHRHLKEAGFDSIKIDDITENTLVPFYKKYENNIKPDTINNSLPYILNEIYKYSNKLIAERKPFSYILVECTK